MYRLAPEEEEPPQAELVTLRRYLDPMGAELDKAQLLSEGIRAFAFEPTAFNPLLTGAAGGVELRVSSHDVKRAEAVLGRRQPGEDDPSEGDGEPEGAVRCPRCELAYCFHERARVTRGAGLPIVAILTLPAMLFGAKRWNCHRCGHTWDDPSEGPREVTRLLPDDPRPVFLLRRARAGMGLFISLIVAVFAGLVLSGTSAREMVPLLLLVPLFGWAIGKALHYDVCSEPECRALLSPGAEVCSRCRGSVAGIVKSAEQHYVAAANFRRELAAIRKADAAKMRAPKKKKRALRSG